MKNQIKNNKLNKHVKEILQWIQFDQVLYHHFVMINEENDHGHK
jgi:hypothetical protein